MGVLPTVQLQLFEVSVYLDCRKTMFVAEGSLARNPHKEQAWSNQVAEFMVTWQGEVSGTLWN